MSNIVNDGRVKQDLIAELESNDESLDDVRVVQGRVGDERTTIRPEYLDAELYSRWHQHVAYTSDYVYYSVLVGRLRYPEHPKWEFESTVARPGVDVPGPRDHQPERW
jgi:hypothetical protein